MQRCLTIAAKGLGHVAPNPMVGCVIVYNGNIIAEGYHQVYGGLHAEPNAIKQVDDTLLKNCTLYVNLEPCSHYGKTPPCADLIISKGIKKVFVGNLDTNPLVAGKGIKKLQDAGIAVEYGILNDTCRELNKRFFTFHEKKRPYIILKWAQTQDGFISQQPLPVNKGDNWITGEESKLLVHHWRTEEQAILVGYNTALIDNPLLTSRLATGKNPLRVLIDEHLELPNNLAVFNNDAETLVFNAKETTSSNHIQYIKIDFKNLISEILKHLHSKNVSSIIIEGGTKTINDFISQNLWDEARVFVNPNKTFINGLKAPVINILQANPQLIGADELYILKNKNL
jgi:diaminohydroxyphosphoribosylaminopyrimidine deaminase/5-amino-6-(5-phosphoribosylamino)uracil reductase